MFTLYFLVVLFGLSLGSFANVLIYRLPKNKSLKGRSHCPRCNHALSWADLIPVFSFLFLRGNCRFCRGTISWQYPIVETTSAFLALLAFRQWFEQGPAVWLFYLFWLELFLVLFFTDLRYLLLPDKLLASGLSLILVWSGWQRLGGLSAVPTPFSWPHLLTAAVFLGLLFLVWFFSRGRWLGLGDAKLMGLIGLTFGPAGAIFIFYTAIIVGGIIGLGLFFSKRADLKTKLPLGSFVSLAAIFYLFNGLAVADYLRFYLMFN